MKEVESERGGEKQLSKESTNRKSRLCRIGVTPEYNITKIFPTPYDDFQHGSLKSSLEFPLVV